LLLLERNLRHRLSRVGFLFVPELSRREGFGRGRRRWDGSLSDRDNHRRRRRKGAMDLLSDLHRPSSAVASIDDALTYRPSAFRDAPVVLGDFHQGQATGGIRRCLDLVLQANAASITQPIRLTAFFLVTATGETHAEIGRRLSGGIGWMPRPELVGASVFGIGLPMGWLWASLAFLQRGRRDPGTEFRAVGLRKSHVNSSHRHETHHNYNDWIDLLGYADPSAADGRLASNSRDTAIP